MKRILSYPMTFSDTLKAYKLLLKRLCEIGIEELEREYPDAASLDELDELYLRAHLQELVDRVSDALDTQRTPCPPTTPSELRTQTALIAKHHPDLAKVFHVPSGELKADVAERLASFKRRAGDQFARDFLSAIDRLGISSPIEQIFLLEWKHRRIEENFDVQLIPQATVDSRFGAFSIDFLVTSNVESEKPTRIGIELDGHDFHEKTKDQAARDKKRERAIIASGITVLRFAGSEIVWHTAKCIDEIVDFLKLA